MRSMRFVVHFTVLWFPLSRQPYASPQAELICDQEGKGHVPELLPHKSTADPTHTHPILPSLLDLVMDLTQRSVKTPAS